MTDKRQVISGEIKNIYYFYRYEYALSNFYYLQISLFSLLKHPTLHKKTNEKQLISKQKPKTNHLPVKQKYSTSHYGYENQFIIVRKLLSVTKLRINFNIILLIDIKTI